MKIDVFGSYLEAQAEFPKKAREPQLAITISREVGAGAVDRRRKDAGRQPVGCL